jgi:hypothetical protein
MAVNRSAWGRAMKWITVQSGLSEHTVNIAQIAQVTAGLSGAKVLHLSNGQEIVVSPKEWQRVWAAINGGSERTAGRRPSLNLGNR